MESTITLNQTEKESLEIFLPIWNRWLEEITEPENGSSLYRMAAWYAQNNGLPERNPLSLMFAAFCGGIDEGIGLADIIDQMAKDKAASGKTK